MSLLPRRSTVSALAVAALSLAAGCTGQPTVVPAGSVGLEVPATAPAPANAQANAQARTVKASSKRAPATTPAAARSDAPEVAAKAPVVSVEAERPAAKPAARSPKRFVKNPAVEAAPTKQSVARIAALPRAGTYEYAVTGTSSLGPPPATSTLVVDEVGGGAQLWTLDFRREDGAGLVEELTLRREAAGVFLSAYRLDASTGLAGVILEFAPSSPVMLTPTAGKAGKTWRFDLGTSKDGCATAKGVGALLDTGDGSSTRRFRVSTTVRTAGPASCVQLNGERVQEIAHPRAALLPSTIDSDLRGTVAGVAFAAKIEATRSADAQPNAVGPRWTAVGDRVRR